MPSKSRAVARLLSQTRDENIATDRYDRPRPARRSHDADSDSTRTLGAGTASIKGVGMLPKEDEMDRSSVGTAELEDQKGVAEEGVSQAIEALAKMERRLRRAVKRQKIKIEESTIPAPIPAPEDPPNRRASRPRLVKSKQKSIGEAVQEHLPTPERDVQDSEYEDDGAAPTKKAEEDTIEVAERGAARPPPINSQYLPLPWQGRLGYVGSPSAEFVPPLTGFRPVLIRTCATPSSPCFARGRAAWPPSSIIGTHFRIRPSRSIRPRTARTGRRRPSSRWDRRTSKGWA